MTDVHGEGETLWWIGGLPRSAGVAFTWGTVFAPRDGRLPRSVGGVSRASSDRLGDLLAPSERARAQLR